MSSTVSIAPRLRQFSRNTIRVAYDAVERSPSKCGAQPMRALVARQIVKTLVGILGQHQPGEQARGFFRLRNFRVGLAGVLSKLSISANRLKVHPR